MTPTLRCSSLCLGLALALVLPTVGRTEPTGATCGPDEPTLDRYAYLRALSLDLLGRLPTMDEYAALDDVTEVPEATIENMLASPAFAQRAVRFHRKLLWTNIEDVRLVDFRSQLRRTGERYWRTDPARRYRGQAVPCLDEPASFDADGRPIAVEQPDGSRREGWVEVQPYFWPDTTIKVCAFDAEIAARSPLGTDCSTRAGLFDAGCGCGPDLQRCGVGQSPGLQRAFARDIDQRIEAVIREGRAYTDIFTSRKAFVNGPMVHYLKHQARLASGISTTPMAYDLDRLPDLSYADAETFVEVELPSDHAGVLTSYPFLLRFQTNRARANRYFESFLCQPFTPPPGGLPVVSPDNLPHPDLQQRDGCKYCHALLEPAASHWGRWRQQGAGYLTPQAYPPVRQDCMVCATTPQACSSDCRQNYVTSTFSAAEVPYLGQLEAYRFLRDTHRNNVEQGPKLLVASTIVDDRFPTCTARRALEGLFGRALVDVEQATLPALGKAFVQSRYDYRALVKAIVTHPVYRRVR